MNDRAYSGTVDLVGNSLKQCSTNKGKRPELRVAGYKEETSKKYTEEKGYQSTSSAYTSP